MLFWDILLVGGIAIATYYGYLSEPAAVMLAAIVLLATAFSISFSPARLVAGITLRLLALGIVALNQQVTSVGGTRESAVLSTTASPVAKDRSSDDAGAARQSFAAASPPRRMFDERSFPQGMDCGWYRVQPGFSCAGRSQGGRFPDYAPPPPMSYSWRPRHRTVETYRAVPRPPRERYYRDCDRWPRSRRLEI
jgi:hypothetical protein